MNEVRREVPKLSGRVLLVEDEPEITAMMLRRLKRYGPTVDAVVDYKTAIVQLKEQSYDLVLCDFNVTHEGSWKNGGHILSFARERCPDLPFYFVSGLFELIEKEKQQKLLQKATGYVHKPISHADLEAILVRHLKPAI